MSVSITRKEVCMTQRGNPPIGYYTATRTKRALGNISDGLLRTYVEKGLVRRFVPSGRSQGFYDQEDVRRLAKSLDNFPVSGMNEHKEQFCQASEADIPGAVRILIDVFGGSDTTEKRVAWLRKNPETCFVVKSDQLVTGVVFLLPLTAQKIERIFADPTSSTTRSIAVDDIQVYRPELPVQMYIASLAAKPGVDATAKRTRGALLLRGLFAHLVDLGRRGIIIETVVGRSDTLDGINLLKKMGFTEIEPQGENRNFVIEVRRSGVPFIMQYKSALEENSHAA